jgi:hypothetical protein
LVAKSNSKRRQEEKEKRVKTKINKFLPISHLEIVLILNFPPASMIHLAHCTPLQVPVLHCFMHPPLMYINPFDRVGA